MDSVGSQRQTVAGRLRSMPPAFGSNWKRNGASRPVTTGNFSIHHRTARAVPPKAGGIGREVWSGRGVSQTTHRPGQIPEGR